MKNKILTGLLILMLTLTVQAQPACVPEGEYFAIVPGAPDCCPGLTPVGCGEADQYGVCDPCTGASYCTYCGDGICGLGENECRCPQDCPPTIPTPETPLIALAVLAAPGIAYLLKKRI